MGPFQPSLRGDTTSFYILKTIALTAPPPRSDLPKAISAAKAKSKPIHS